MIRGELPPERSAVTGQVLLFSFVALFVIGLLMVLDTTFLLVENPYHYFVRTVAFIVPGVFAFLAGRYVKLESLQRVGRLLVPLSFLLLLMLWLTPLGREINGARRWLSFGFFMVQPSEFAKVALVVYLADFLARKSALVASPRAVLLPPAIFLGLLLVPILLTPDLGTVVLCVVTALFMYLAAGIPARYFLLLGASGAAGASLMIMTVPYRVQRVLGLVRSWRNPVDFDGAYHLSQALTAIGRGGVFGVGPGNARQKLFFLPEVHTDSVFAHFAETFGLVGSLFFIALFLAVVVAGLRVAGRVRERFSALLMVGLVSMFAFQAFMHIGGNIGLLPLKGLTLPFVSYGGSSLLVSFFCAGLMLNIAGRQGAVENGSQELPPAAVPAT